MAALVRSHPIHIIKMVDRDLGVEIVAAEHDKRIFHLSPVQM